MSKFCGNCGAELNDDAKVCGICGTPLAGGGGAAVNAAGGSYVTPEKKEKNKKIFLLALAGIAAVVIIVIAVNIISGFVGYKGAVRKIMNAYKDFDIDTIVSMSSDYYSWLDSDEYVEKYFDNIISEDLDMFESQVGHDYKISYKINDKYEMSKRKYDDLIDSLTNYSDFDADTISKVMIVEVEVTAKGSSTDTTYVNLTLTKENGAWKLLYMS